MSNRRERLGLRVARCMLKMPNRRRRFRRGRLFVPSLTVGVKHLGARLVVYFSDNFRDEAGNLSTLQVHASEVIKARRCRAWIQRCICSEDAND